ncbi:uncharacterized protein LOC8085902 [Sorghum bicolor]|uniref:Uncharacterized protein n=1 Tax=Sorghum bicolor TaxID=4558 RepID=C5YUF8_SORBI|nr:uncharacterized protein LOC8085902 [Sorghum bicolor]EES19862.1 hypothetical protein SORBI_3009G208900 [Sorghum bicolor]|eukprot:XP_002441432.1 uncharacterized protein LOC8085902 [Sorghum bicolor]
MQKRLGGNSTARRRHLSGLSGSKARPALESLIGKPPPPADPATPATRTTDAEVDAALARTALAGIVSQKSLRANSTARRRPLTVLSGNMVRPALESLIGKPTPPATPAAQATAAEVDAALDRLLFARTDLAGIITQVDELLSDALKYETVSKRATQEIESFNVFLTDTKASFKQWSSRLKQALETGPVKTEAISKNTPEMCLNTAAKGNGKLIIISSKLPDTDPVASPCSNFTEPDMIVSPSPLVSWHTGSCMVESGKQLFHLTPVPKTKACSSRCTTSKTQMNTASSIDESNNLLRLSKLTISDDNHPDLEQSVKAKESWTGTMTPHVAPANKASLEDKLCSPCTSSNQKSRALPRSCLKTALSSKQQLFSPIPEDSRKEDIDSNGPTGDDKRSGSSDEILKDLASRYDIYGLDQSTRQAEDPPTGDDKRSGSSSDEISKDLASRYDINGLNRPTRQAKDPLEWSLEWFLSPLKTMVLTDPSDNNPLLIPAWTNMEGKLNVPDDKSIQTPSLHGKALLGTPWKGLESTNLKGRLAGETTLKKELWTRFEAASANELHFDKARFQKTDAKCFLDMLEEEAS